MEQARAKRQDFVDFLQQSGITYRLGISRGFGWYDPDELLRVEFDLSGGRTISALFSPEAITGCQVETSGIYPEESRNPIYHWDSVDKLCTHLVERGWTAPPAGRGARHRLARGLKSFFTMRGVLIFGGVVTIVGAVLWYRLRSQRSCPYISYTKPVYYIPVD